MRSRVAVLALVLAAGAASVGHSRRPSPPTPLTNEIRSLYAHMFGDGVPLQDLRSLQKQARRAVAGVDLDGGGLSKRDIELARNMADARTGADRVRHYFGADLDHDGALTLAEYQALLHVGDVQAYYYAYEDARSENRPPAAGVTRDRTREDGSLVETFRRIDRDRDGRVTLQEVFTYDPAATAAYAPAETFVDGEKYLVLDSDGDGNVTMAEVDYTSAAFLAEQALAGVGPGRTPKPGVDRRPRRLEDAVRCRVPAPSGDARIVRLGTRESGQISNIALAGQDEPTYVVNVAIEPGPEPLYIVASSTDATLWRLSGATKRVQAFVASSRERDARSMWPAVGVTGLPASRFHAAPYVCFGEFTEGAKGPYLEASDALRLIRKRFGRTIDVPFGAYAPQGVSLPSAQPFKVPTMVPKVLAKLRSERAAVEWKDFLVHFPGGVASLNPKQVVSRTPPEHYQVYPYGAGLAQLLELGALAPMPEVSDFEIRRPFRFPAGLAGGFSETFRLPDGVPPPTGHPAHSRVLSASNPKICLIGCR